MSLLDELHPATYKGVKFLMMISSVIGGRKSVRHEFPNSDKQTIEDLGLAPKIFNVTAVISGDSYIQDRSRFISVLEDGEPGVLAHPWFGQLNNYVARTYTLLENLTSLGEAKFTITFEISNTEGVPVKAQNTLSIISAANDTTIAAVVADFAANYNVNTGFIGNFTDAVAKSNSVITAFRNNITVIAATGVAQVNELTKQLDAFENNVNGLIGQPQDLIDSISELYSTTNTIYDTPADNNIVFEQFFDFGDTDTTINPTTAGLIERLNNRDIMNQANQILALSYTYFNTAQIDFETVDQIEESADTLETQYQKVITGDGLTDETKSVLTDMRTAMQEFFEEQRLNARQIIEVDTNLTSARLLAFQYYADSSEAGQLIELNQFEDVSFIEGVVKVLTE